MFSFIKWFGSLIDRIKRNKGMWFTTLTTLSLIGIFASLYFVNFLVSDVAKKTYENQKNHYVLEFKNRLKEQTNFVESLASVIAKDETIAQLIFSGDENSTKKLDNKIKSIEQKLNDIWSKNNIKISLTHSQKAQKSIGFNVNKDGAVIEAVIPMADNKGDIINVQLQKKIDSLVKVYKNEGRDFVFLLSQNSINKIYQYVHYNHYYHDLHHENKQYSIHVS